jgi:glycosyltransferase involved in cell wall biosynthesis/Flp pilus assembly protein TadD
VIPRISLNLPGLALDTLIRAGDKANSARDWKTAEVAYANALKKDPQLAHIWVQYGHALKEQGRLQPAENAYRRALALDGTVADTHLQLGHLLKLQKRPTEAADAYRSAWRLDPGLTAAFDELRSMGPDPAKFKSVTVDAGLSALIRAGDTANSARDWKSAEIAYADALKKDPQLTHIWVQYGHALKEQGRLRPAENAYRRALALDGTVADTYLQLGHVLKLQRRPTEAVDAYRAAFRFDPGMTAAFDELRGMGADPGDVESTVDIEFVNRLYDLDLKKSRIKPSDDEISALIQSKTSSSTAYLNREMLVAANHLSLRLLDIFDEDFYFYCNKISDANLPSPCFAKCLLHFCDMGIDRLLPFNPDYVFDYEFYCDNFLIGNPCNGDAYRHWLRDGIDQGWAPNERVWMRDTLGSVLVDPDVFYSLFNRNLSNKLRSVRKRSEPDEFVAMIAEGGPPDPPKTEDAARGLSQIADLLATRGENEVASVIYDRVLQRFPDMVETLQHYADMLFRNARYPAARAFYEKVRYLGSANIWTYINLAECLKFMRDYNDALAALSEGADRFPHDVGIRERYTQLADEFFNKQIDTAYSEARMGWLAEAQDRLAEACRVVTARSPSGSPIARRINSVAIVGNEDLPQCRFYRIDQKIEQLNIAGYFVKLYDYRHQLDDFIEEIYRFQAVIFYRLPASPKVIKAIENANELGLFTFYEIDDLIFDRSEYPTSYESYGGQISRDEYIGLCLGVPLFSHAMSLCAYGIGSTPTLTQQMSRHVTTRRAFTHRNAFGSKHEAYRTFRRRTNCGDDGITIFYGSGTKAHKEDFEELVVPALAEMVQRYGSRISIVIVGYVTISKQLRSIRDNITLFDTIWNVDDYWKVLSGADINIAVLKPSLMADCKSEIKWLEAAMFAIPSVVSRTATYAEVMENGVSGFLCGTQAEWVTALEQLVCNAELREEMGLAAQRRAHRVYALDTMANRLGAIFNSVHPGNVVTKPTVVIVNVFYPPQAFGGATRVVKDNVRHFIENYADVFNVEVFTSIQAVSGFYETRSYMHNGVRVTGVITPHIPDIDNRANDQRMREIFGKYLDTVSPELVHFHCIQRLTASVVEAAHERGIPYLITVHDGWWISDEQFIVDETGRYNLYDYTRQNEMMRTGRENTYLRMMALRQALFNAHRVLAVSEPFASIYRTCGVPNVITVGNGISDIPQRDRLSAPDERVRIAFIGGMAAHKGYRLVRNAFLSETFEHLTLTIVDHSRPQGYSRREVWGTTPVNFIGLIPQTDIFDLYCQTDVVLAPSIWPESYGLVTREALASGCWVVASDRGAIGECIVDDENGYVIDASDIGNLVGTLRRIDSDHLRYLTAPKKVGALRTAAEQGDELARLYSKTLNCGKSCN